jgi:glutamate dehydrogenase
MSPSQLQILYAINAYSKQLKIQDIDFDDFMSSHKSIAEKLISCFEARFNPENPKAIPFLESEIGEVDLKHKKIVSVFYELITKVILRTNYYKNQSFLSFKVNLASLSEDFIKLEKPITYREIFIFSHEFEGIHLRNGKIARGGLRWSDRMSDFRTEILGLVKTQNTKNTVVIPVGSKGGFVVKKYPDNATMEQKLEFGKECYKKFIFALLEITDNVVHGEVKTPENIVIYDEQDPYLAVAADKGTAKFSDIANEIAESFNFWLGDAFASGGKNGYDHKKIAITSRGAWVATERHFGEMCLNVYKDEFSVVGIGDMSGDVFGNGLLRSNKMKLIFAFNHMNIFVDPNPNTDVSFEERKRLFNLPYSTWEDYNLEKASKGAKIFKRTDSKCELTPEIQALFEIKESSISPEELIKTALKSNFDLLWNGGVGTYIKSHLETHEEVLDAVNDVLRINGSELGAKVVTEGGNLGLTQKGRVEFALNGGRINTDAIDNSAGVDCSDHEVNIKILLNALVAKNELSKEQRNTFIHSITESVSNLVLEDNYNQGLAISLERNSGVVSNNYEEFVKMLENVAHLDSKSEKLPSFEEIKTRKLTRPSLSILLAYTKMEVYDALIDSNVIKDEYCEKFLINYFPLEMREKFLPQILSHQLKWEIISTVMSNKFVNFGGMPLAFYVQKETKKTLPEVIKAYFIASHVLRLESIFEDIKNSDNKVPVQKQYDVLCTVQKKILTPTIIKILNSYNLNDGIQELCNTLSKDIKKLQINKDDLTFVNV